MPISQITKTSQIEKLPTAAGEKIKSAAERESLALPEAFKTEFGQDRLVEAAKLLTSLSRPAVQPRTDAGFKVNEKVRVIEGILEEDLGDVYFKLSPLKQQEFKVRGEETAIKIMNILAKPKIKIKRIMSLIREWLNVIPGINKFFLEQTVKIKTDKIIRLKK